MKERGYSELVENVKRKSVKFLDVDKEVLKMLLEWAYRDRLYKKNLSKKKYKRKIN